MSAGREGIPGSRYMWSGSRDVLVLEDGVAEYSE